MKKTGFYVRAVLMIMLFILTIVVKAQHMSVFSCGDSITDDRNGKVYHTILIGTQCWMKENMNVGTMLLSSESPQNNYSIEKYCYNDSIQNCEIYGGLYKWNEMMEYITDDGAQGICLSGWHVPTDGDWYYLESNVDPYGIQDPDIPGWRGTVAGTRLKTGGTSGFDALFGGELNSGSFDSYKTNAYFWTSSPYNKLKAWGREMTQELVSINKFNIEKEMAYSVRCILGQGITTANNLKRNNSLIKIYPNPASEFIWVNISTTESVNAEIYNVLGEIIFSVKITNNQSLIKIDVSSLSDGLYILKINSPNHSTSNKVLIKH